MTYTFLTPDEEAVFDSLRRIAHRPTDPEFGFQPPIDFDLAHMRSLVTIIDRLVAALRIADARLNFLSMDQVSSDAGYDAVSCAHGSIGSTRRAAQRSNIRQVVDALAHDAYGDQWIEEMLEWGEVQRYTKLDEPQGGGEWYGPRDEFCDFVAKNWTPERPQWYQDQIVQATRDIWKEDPSIITVDDIVESRFPIPSGTKGLVLNLYPFEGQIGALVRFVDESGTFLAVPHLYIDDGVVSPTVEVA